ncbi:MAG: glycosyltransferase family 39 protein [bacterium]
MSPSPEPQKPSAAPSQFIWGRLAHDKTHVAVWVLFAAALLLRFVFLTHKGFWNNEFITLHALRLSPGDLLVERLHRNHMPLYFEFLKGWIVVFGESEFSVKFPSAIFSFLQVLFGFKLARRFINRDAGLTVALFLALSQLSLWSSLEVRMYSLVMAVAIAATYYFLIYVEERNPRAGVMCALLMFVGLLSHLLIGFLLVLLGFYWFAHRRALRVRPAGVCLVLFSPWVLASPILLMWLKVQYIIAPSDDSGQLRLSNWCRTLLKLFWGDYSELLSHAVRGIAILLLLLVMIGVVRYARRSAKTNGASDPAAERPGLQLRIFRLGLAWALGLPLAILAFSTCVSSTLGDDRYYSPSIGGFALVFYFGLTGWPQLKFRRLLLIFSALLLTAYSMSYLLAKGDGVRESIAYLKQKLQPDDALLICQGGATRYAFTYYDVPLAGILGVNRDIRDPEQLLDRARRVAEGRPRRIWLFLYHEKTTPIFQVFAERTAFFRLVQPQRVFREVKISCFEALPALFQSGTSSPVPSQGNSGD